MPVGSARKRRLRREKAAAAKAEQEAAAAAREAAGLEPQENSGFTRHKRARKDDKPEAAAQAAEAEAASAPELSAAGTGAAAAAVAEAAQRYYGADAGYPSHYEPGGDDFLSGALTEAALMSALLPQDAFSAWLAGFLPDLAGAGHAALLAPVMVADRSDPKTVHLDGLHLSRAWCLRLVCRALPTTHPARPRLLAGAAALAAASLPHVDSGDYGGEHWLATFAVLALDAG